MIELFRVVPTVDGELLDRARILNQSMLAVNRTFSRQVEALKRRYEDMDALFEQQRQRQKLELEDFQRRIDTIVESLEVEHRTIQLSSVPLFPTESALAHEIRSRVQDQEDIDH